MFHTETRESHVLIVKEKTHTYQTNTPRQHCSSFLYIYSLIRSPQSPGCLLRPTIRIYPWDYKISLHSWHFYKKNVTASHLFNSDICRAQEFKKHNVAKLLFESPVFMLGITKRSQWEVYSSYHCPQNRLKSLTVFAVMSFWQEWLAQLRFVSTLCAAEAQPCLHPGLSHSSKWCFNAPRSL